MKSNTLTGWLAQLTVGLLLACANPLRAADPIILIQKYANGSIPLYISGFSGEVDSTLRFDLAIAGFDLVSEDKAAFLLSGSNNGRVEGRLIVRASKQQIVGKAFTGDNLRRLAHALADEVVLAATQVKGIAQTRIVFKVDTGPNSEIYIADYDGHNPIQVTHDNTIVAAPTWAPGHRTVFYTSYKLGNPDIYAHELSTGSRRVVAGYSGLNTSAAISPDGRRMAMILSKSGSPDLWVSDVDGKNLKQLTATREDESSPCWSPDSSTICFVSRMSGRPALYTVSASGGAPSRLRTSGVSNVTEPDWSPDGKTIVFTSQGGGFNICTVPAGGGEATPITSGEDPSWAPNSRTVIFAHRVQGKRVLSLLDVPTKRVKDIQQVSGSCSQPDWAK